MTVRGGGSGEIRYVLCTDGLIPVDFIRFRVRTRPPDLTQWSISCDPAKTSISCPTRAPELLLFLVSLLAY